MGKWSSNYPSILTELAQETFSIMTKPHGIWWQSGEILVDTSSTLPQRQVTDAPPPLTADSFDGNTGQPGAIPDDRLRSAYNQVRELVAA